MAPKTKSKKSKGESEEEKLIREEDDKKQRDAEAKVIADEAERLSAEQLRIQTERRDFRVIELAALNEENSSVLEKLSSLESRMASEIFFEVTYRGIFSLINYFRELVNFETINVLETLAS